MVAYADSTQVDGAEVEQSPDCYQGNGRGG